MTTAREKIVAARVSLILNEPFFGALALRLTLVEDPTAPTMWTDGRVLGFNPAFVDPLDAESLKGVVCHEVLHCSNGHPWRRDSRDPTRWNIAADYAINPIVIESGLRLPGQPLIEPSYTGKNAEWIFNQLPESTSNGGGGSTGPGEVRDAPADGHKDGTTEAEWKIDTIRAARAAKARGNLPASIARLIEEITAPVVDWRAVLRRFVQSTARSDYSWRNPSRRYLAAGLYLPELRSESMPPVCIGWDTSGSRDSAKARAECATEIASIIDEVEPESTHVIYCDTRVHRIDEFPRGESPTFRPVGGGGTDFRPIFDAADLIEPACLIVITDMEGMFPTDAPSYPVLWASTDGVTEAPFGEVVSIKEEN